MKILIAAGIYPPDIGGPATYAKSLADEFAKRGIESAVVAYGETEKSRQDSSTRKDRARVFKISRNIPKGLRHLSYLWNIFKNIKSVGIVLAFDASGAGFPAFLTSKIFRKKIIIRLGGDFLWESAVEKGKVFCSLREFYASGCYKKFFRSRRLIIGFVLRNADIAVFSTGFQRDIFLKYYRLKPERTRIIKNPFSPPSKFLSGSVENDKKGKLFLFTGRILKLKNLDLLIEVFKEVAAVEPQTKLLIIGEGPEEHSIKLKIKNLKLDESVFIKAKITHEELLKKISESYLCLLPSLTEISPNFALECVSSLTPVILTEETGIKEDFKNLLYFNPKDKNDLFDKIKFLLDVKNYREYKSQIGKINFNRSWKEVADEWLKLL